MSQPNVCVLNAPGINCNLETAHAFEQFGAQTEQVHISQLRSGDRRLSDFQILALSGGFSDGDTIASGRTLGIELRTQLTDELNRFVDAGGFMIGICNGFQVLTETGLLPHGQIDPSRPKAISLVHNSRGHFVDNWQNLRVEQSVCPFAQPDDIGELIQLPVANGEGRMVAANSEAMACDLRDKRQIVFRYATSSGIATEEFPHNPSGSPFGITGICDASGRILGLMPHPERFINKFQHPNWRRGEGQTPYGALIIKRLIEVAKES